LRDLVTHRYPLSRVVEAMRRNAAYQGRVVKVVITGVK
jgi:hypothetical protein